ncbi:hypothetical protein CsSME_00048979 [Camellia sinensis var. sinensis]
MARLEATDTRCVGRASWLVEHTGQISYTVLPCNRDGRGGSVMEFVAAESREIDREEFKRVMALMRAHNRQGAIHRDGL